MSKQSESVANESARDQDFITAKADLERRLDRWSTYHDHKETMAHAAILVSLGLVAGVVATPAWDSWAPSVDLSQRLIATVGVVLAWFLLHLYIRWQLRNRRIAAMSARAYRRVLRTWETSRPTPADLQPNDKPLGCSSVKRTIDKWIFPLDGTIREEDLDEGFVGLRRVIVKEFEAASTGASNAERLVSIGSLLLGVVLILNSVFGART